MAPIAKVVYCADNRGIETRIQDAWFDCSAAARAYKDKPSKGTDAVDWELLKSTYGDSITLPDFKEVILNWKNPEKDSTGVFEFNATDSYTVQHKRKNPNMFHGLSNVAVLGCLMTVDGYIAFGERDGSKNGLIQSALGGSATFSLGNPLEETLREEAESELGIKDLSNLSFLGVYETTDAPQGKKFVIYAMTPESFSGISERQKIVRAVYDAALKGGMKKEDAKKLLKAISERIGTESSLMMLGSMSSWLNVLGHMTDFWIL